MPAPATTGCWPRPRPWRSWHARLGEGTAARPQALAYGETSRMGDTTVWLAPAGHVLGSAQVVIEHRGCRAVYSGDYKRQPDPTCAAFTPVPCDLFITEATFGLPVFRHPDPAAEIARLLHSVATFPERCHVIGAYALGKAQRLIALLRQAGWDHPIFLHGALIALVRPLPRLRHRPRRAAPRHRRRQGRGPPGAHRPDRPRPARRHRRPLGPPPARPRRLHGLGLDAREAARQAARRRAAPGHLRPRRLGRAPGDHARRSGAPEVWITHGREEALAHAAGQRGIRARALALVGYEEEGA